MSIKTGQYATRCTYHTNSKLVTGNIELECGVHLPIFRCSTCDHIVMSVIADHGSSYFVRGSMSYEEHIMYVMSEKTTKRKKV
jgi:hypothetical protein